MIVSELKKGICVIAALGMAILSNGVVPVSAEGQESGETVFDPAADLTEQQYYFQDEYGVVFPGWNQYNGETPAANVTQGIVVAVVGTGVDYTHEDLQNVMWDDGETYTALTALGGGKYGFNANGTADKSDPMDENGDGTRAASIIAAEWNKKGISGALSGAEIMAVKTSAGTAVSALNYVLAAKKAGVKVAAVNLSSAVIRTTNADAVSDLVSQLGKEGIITVISAGDKGADLDKGSAVYETLRANPYVIVAAGTGKSGAFWEKSSYGERNCSVLAPGENILAADITKTSGNNEGEPGGETGETPAVSNNYTSLSGTSASAAIVTAAAAYLYDKLPDLEADERAARLIENADVKEALAGKASGGLVNPEAAADEDMSAPLADHIIIKEENADIRGYDFGTTAGTVKVDGERVSSSVWSSGKITVKADVFPAGEHTVEITRADNKSSSRKLLVDGDEPSEELPTKGFPEDFVIDAVTLLNDELYATGHKAEQEVDKVQSLYHYNEEEKEWKPIQATPYTFIANDSCSDGTYIYTITDGPTILKTDPGESDAIIYTPQGNTVTNTRISYLSDKLIVSGTDNDTVTLKECRRNGDEGYVMAPLGTFEEDENVRCIDVVKTDGKLLAVCVESLSSVVSGEQLAVYEVTTDEQGEPVVRELFKEKTTHPAGTYTNAGAVSNGEVISVYRASEEDGIVVSEFSTDGQPIREVTVLKDAVSSVKGEIDSEGNLYLAGNTGDAEKPNFALSFKTGEKPAPAPTPTTTPTATPTPTSTPTPAPTSAPTSKPEKTAAPAPAPASTVQTCQDAGFPAGWYWNESKKACVAPATAAPANNSTAGNDGNRPDGTNTGNGTNNGSGNNGAYSGTLTPEPTETPEATETPKPTETPEATEEPEKTAAPIEIINTKGILWFLGIPVLMILSGLAVFLTKNRGLIPWIIAGDAIGSVVLAILDHSVVGWILVVLNLAAVGLLALYRSGKQDEEDDEFEEE